MLGIIINPKAGKKAMPIADFLRGQHLDGIWKIVPYPVLN